MSCMKNIKYIRNTNCIGSVVCADYKHKADIPKCGCVHQNYVTAHKQTVLTKWLWTSQRGFGAFRVHCMGPAGAGGQRPGRGLSTRRVDAATWSVAGVDFGRRSLQSDKPATSSAVFYYGRAADCSKVFWFVKVISVVNCKYCIYIIIIKYTLSVGNKFT